MENEVMLRSIGMSDKDIAKLSPGQEKMLADLLSKVIREVARGNDPLGETFTIDCPDPGIDNGGLGSVRFKARIEQGLD